MPNPSDYESKDDFMGACVPKMMSEHDGMQNDQAVAACMNMWEKKSLFAGMTMEEAVKHFTEYVSKQEEPNAEDTKVGARHSRQDLKDMQTLHDIAVRQGAACAITKSAAFVGNELKAISRTDDELRVANYMVVFGGRDLTGFAGKPNINGTLGEYFSKNTDLESDYTKTGRLYVDFEHSMDPDGLGIGSDNVLGYVDWKTAQKDERGIFVERVLNRRNKYVKWLEELIDARLIGNSTEAVRGLTERTEDGEIVKWPLKRDTLTVSPAEPRMLGTNALAAAKALSEFIPELKSLIPLQTGRPEGSEQKGTEAKPTKESDMDENTIKAMFQEQTTALGGLIEEKAAAAAKSAVEEALKALPELKQPSNVQVVKDEADQPWKSIGEFFMAVKNAAYPEIGVDARLRPLRVSRQELMAEGNSVKATGMNEAIPSQGGFTVAPQYAPGIMEHMFNTGTLLSLFSRDPVAGNSMTYNMVDETSRATGSRHGGVTGYWGAEAGTKTSSKGKFSQLELKLRKVYALCVATDELLEDSAALGSWISRVAPDELRFMTEDAIINGLGGWQPLGILQSGALISVTRNDANEIDVDDIASMWARRYAGANDYVWLGNQGIFPQLVQLSIGNSPVFLPAGGISNLPYGTIFGRPYFDIEYAPALGTAGDLMLVSPSQYQLIEKAGGIQSASSIHVYFTSDETAFRFVYRVDGAPSWNGTLTGKDAVTVSPFVVLSASS